MLFKLILIALPFFFIFGVILFTVQKRKNKRKKPCSDSRQSRCASCSCDRF